MTFLILELINTVFKKISLKMKKYMPVREIMFIMYVSIKSDMPILCKQLQKSIVMNKQMLKRNKQMFLK